MTSDYEAAGIPMERAGVRVDRLTESLAVLRGLWDDGPCSFEGEHYRIDGLDGRPKPATLGGPPLVIGGGRRRVLPLPAPEADNVALHLTLAPGLLRRPAFQSEEPPVGE